MGLASPSVGPYMFCNFSAKYSPSGRILDMAHPLQRKYFTPGPYVNDPIGKYFWGFAYFHMVLVGFLRFHLSASMGGLPMVF